jgi:hypothetical protein
MLTFIATQMPQDILKVKGRVLGRRLGDLTAPQRAVCAVVFREGQYALVEPTLVQLSRLFEVSVVDIRRAEKVSPFARAEIMRGTRGLVRPEEAARELITRVGIETVFNLIDEMTAPPIAAE